MQSLFKLVKNILFLFPVSLIFSPLNKLFLFLYHYNKLITWIYKNKKKFISSDFFSLVRNYEKRYTLYQFVNDHFKLKEKKILYLEFGVASGASFKWWLAHNENKESKFVGFDTFEGLPENWGSFYVKGDMSFAVPRIDDERGDFQRGLFQDTLPPFLKDHRDYLEQAETKIIHLDADLYSATIVTLSQLFPYLRKGDIILFDEFNVPLHEFKAYQEFIDVFYVTLTPVAAVNNFYQVCFVVE